MALLFMDGFDHYATADLPKKWDNYYGMVISSGSYGSLGTVSRRGSGGVYGDANQMKLNKYVSPNSNTMIAGMAFKSIPFGFVFGFGTTTCPLVIVKLSSTSISAQRVNTSSGNWWEITYSSTAIGSAAAISLSTVTWYYLECKVYSHSSLGTIEAHINGAEVLNVSGVDTTKSGVSMDAVGFCGPGGGGIAIDDFYVCDSSGSVNNDFLGDVRVDVHYPTAEGNAHDWTPSTGANNAALIDETAPNTTDYNSTNTLNAVDTFVTEDLKNTGANLLAVQTNLFHSKEDVGTCLIAPVARPVSTDIVGSNIAPSDSSYTYGLTVYNTNPGNSAPWTEAAFNATEFGYKKTG